MLHDFISIIKIFWSNIRVLTLFVIFVLSIICNCFVHKLLRALQLDPGLT